MNLVIDVGNTRLKYAFFEGDEFVGARYSRDRLLDDVRQLRKDGRRVDVLLSGSGVIAEDIREELLRSADCCVEATPGMKLELKLGYETPGTLGVDRIAICTGGMVLHPGLPLLVIDSGTCITFNYVDPDGVFLGGNISPGLEMRFRALHQFTARLPLLSPRDSYGGIGKTTDDAVRNGVMDGMLYEISYYVKYFLEEHKDGKVIMTGGNSRFLERHLGNEVEFCPLLGFLGLNHMLEYVKICN